MKKKEIIKIIIILVVIYVSYHFFLNWDDFKQGILGIP